MSDLGFENIIYGHYLDREQPVDFKPEADLNYPLIFRVYIKSLDTGEYIDKSPSEDYWAQVPDTLISDTNESRVFEKDVELRTLIDLSLLYNKTGLFGAYQVDISRYNPESEQRLYTEQTALLILTEEGTKIGLE